MTRPHRKSAAGELPAGAASVGVGEHQGFCFHAGLRLFILSGRTQRASATARPHWGYYFRAIEKAHTSIGLASNDLFVNDADRQDLLKTLAEACQQTAWQVQACCLGNGITLPVQRTPARLKED